MKKLFFLPILICCITSSVLFSQGDNCSDALPLGCEISGNNGAYTPTPPLSICGNPNWVENNVWYVFVAETANIEFTIDLSNCSFGAGLQAEIYSTPDCISFTELACYAVSGDLNYTISFVAIPGNTYYLMLDGWSGDVCDYTIEVTNGQVAGDNPIIGTPDVPIGSAAPCSADPSLNVFTIPDILNANSYDWTVTPAGIDYTFNGTTLIINNWNGATSATICVQGINDCALLPGDITCVTVNINPIIPIDPPTGFYCEGTIGYVYPGDGQIYVAPGSPYTVTLTSWQGCDSIITLQVIEHPRTSGLLEEVVCIGGCVVIDGQPYCDPTSGLEIPISTPNYFGCDSTVFLDLEVLNPMVTIEGSLQLDCSGTSTILFANTSNNPNPFYNWSYLWSTPNGSVSDGVFDASVLLVDGPGDYTVEVTLETPDGLACSTVSLPVTVTADLDTIATSTSSTEVPCSGDPIGSATVAASGGGGSYTYLWDSGTGDQTMASATDLAGGTYYVTVTGANGCTALDSATVSVSASIDLTVDNITSVACHGEATGSAAVSAVGGTPTYTYAWNTVPVQSTATATGLSAGDYIVTITDDNGCEVIDTISITEPSDLSSNATALPASCADGSNGQAYVTPNGGTPGYTYLWSPSGQITDTAFNLTAGLYSVTITDANNCTQVIAGIEVSDPMSISVSSTEDDAMCNGGMGSATVVPAGGTPGYTYVWNTVPVQTTATATGLLAGSYSVTITDGAGCELVEAISITEPTGLNSTATALPAACAGSSSGQAYVTPNGGTAGYTYLWSPSGQMTDTAFNLTAGLYSVTITDANNCTEVINDITVGEPDAMTASIIDLQDALCFGTSTGSATAQGTGGNGVYSYQWSLNAGGANTATVSGLAADTYFVTITDGEGCTEMTSVMVTEPSELNVLEVGVVDASCIANDGSIDIDVNGGTGDYTFAWSPGAYIVEDPQNLAGGSYTVTVTDENMCTAELTATVNIPGGLTASATATDLNCYGEANALIDLTVNGGTGVLVYTWSDLSFGNVEDVTNLGAGTYAVTITDENDCSVQTSITIPEPDSISIVSVAVSPASCGLSDGSINLLVSGGTGNYSYAWTNGAAPIANPTNLAAGIYTVVITDDNACLKDTTITINATDGPVLESISSIDAACFGEASGMINVDFVGGQGPYIFDWTGTLFDGNEDLVNVPAGVYELTLTDANNCSTVSNVIVGEPDELTSMSTVIDVLCQGESTGSATVIPQGGTAPYSYLWCDGQITDNAANLPAGSCTVTVTDANGCELETSLMINEPPPLTIALAAVSPVNCNGTATGAIELLIDGGAGTYTYAWSPAADPTAMPQNLLAGNYSVTVTDVNGCSEILTGIEVVEPTVISFSATAQNATCNLSNGSIELVTTGGNGNYSYAWSGGADPIANPQNLAAGNYEVTITDMLGCSTTGMVTVNTPSSLAVQMVQTTDVNCFGDADGTIQVTVSGGTAGYTYAWSGGLDPVSNPENVPAGTYDVTITDADACSIFTSAIIDQPDLLEISVASVIAATCNQSNGMIDIEILGGIPPFTYLWNNGDTNQDPVNLSSGLSEVLVTDGNGCTAMSQIAVTEPDALNALSQTNAVTCFNGADGSIAINTSGGNGPYTYQWSSPGIGNTNTATNLDAGMYSVVITDADGCTFSLLSMLVAEPNPLVQENIDLQAASCNGNDGSIEINFSGGTGIYTYSWTSPTSAFTSIQKDIFDLIPGEYVLVLTDENNCSISIQETIGIPTPPTATASSSAVSCFGESNGSIEILVNGANGNVSYTWSDLSIGDIPNPTDLSAGNYQVTITDEENCEVTTMVTITEPPLLEAQLLTANAVACNGDANGSAAITVLGGTPDYAYLWSNGAMVPDPVGLAPGNYSVTVTDENGCTDVETLEIADPPALILDIASTDALCANENSGAIDLTATGGVGSYDYDWSDDQYDGESQLLDLPAGTYTVIVTDDNGCTASISTNVTAPPVVEISVTTISDHGGFNVSCANLNDGSVGVVGMGGNGGPFTYLWSNGATSSTLVDLAAGTYLLTVSDANGCIEEDSVSLLAPEAINLSLEAVSVSCYGEADGGALISEVQGGLSPYLFSIDGSAFGEGPFTGLSAGNYEIAVEDANGCEEVELIAVPEPTEFVVDLGGDLEIQLGDSVYLLAQSNAVFDTLLWQNGMEDISCLNCPGQWVIPQETTTYEVYAENEQGCIALDELQVRVIKDRLVYIPTGFSPATASVNNVFMIFAGTGVKKVNTFVIADRWGEIVFSDANFLPNDPAHGWDGSFKGKLLNPGVFVYFAEVEFTDGRVELYKGDVTLVR